jgi:conjugal transfer/entry exclusion protein|tara:strand:+ start:217 stop:453 length:237 start_codon:yes stop_codon:yes gene_type:complete
MSKILKKEELAKLQEAVAKVNQIKNEIGNIEVQKHGLLHLAADANNSLSEVQKELEEVYGNVNVDVITGEIAEQESDD